MVYLGIIPRLIEFILCVLYDVVILTVILECAEAIAFYLRAVTAAHVSEEKQIRSLKLVVVYASLIIAIIGITIIRCQILVGTYWLGQEKIALCGRCQRKEREREIRKGLPQSECNWLHGSCKGLFPSPNPKIC